MSYFHGQKLKEKKRKNTDSRRMPIFFQRCASPLPLERKRKVNCIISPTKKVEIGEWGADIAPLYQSRHKTLYPCVVAGQPLTAMLCARPLRGHLCRGCGVLAYKGESSSAHQACSSRRGLGRFTDLSQMPTLVGRWPGGGEGDSAVIPGSRLSLDHCRPPTPWPASVPSSSVPHHLCTRGLCLACLVLRNLTSKGLYQSKWQLWCKLVKGTLQPPTRAHSLESRAEAEFSPYRTSLLNSRSGPPRS